MITAIIAARMGSGRFPGKVLECIDDKPIIQYVVDFLNKIKMDGFLDDIIIATPDTLENEQLWKYLDSNKIKYFKGSNDDVLDRYYQCAKLNNIDSIVRVCADVPFYDEQKIIQQIENYQKDGKFTYGNGAWIFSFDELEESWLNGKHSEDREHVTTRMFNAIDYPEDLEKLKKIFYNDLK
jgi:spore coat polysaccharide biosynthesis protein SpsF (cytidylyltransferase family)